MSMGSEHDLHMAPIKSASDRITRLMQFGVLPILLAVAYVLLIIMLATN